MKITESKLSSTMHETMKKALAQVAENFVKTAKEVARLSTKVLLQIKVKCRYLWPW